MAVDTGSQSLRALNNPGVREPADFRLTVRQSDWSGGYNRLYYTLPGTQTEPRFWDGFNIEILVEGEVQIAQLLEKQGTYAGGDAKLTEFNGFLYLLPNTANPIVQKSADGITWANVSMTSGPTTAIRRYTVWKNNMIVAANAATPYQLTSGDVWSALTAPVGGSNVDAVGVTPDDKLAAWVNSKGLYTTPDGTTWTKIFPAAGVDPAEATCDLLDGSLGTLLIVTRDGKGSQVMEYFTAEGAATQASIVVLLEDKDLFFYSARYYNGACYMGAKKSIGGVDGNGQGILFRKLRGAVPEPVQEFGDGIRGKLPSTDFGVRGLSSDGFTLWVGLPSRAPNFSGVNGIPTIYEYRIDQAGFEDVSPNASIDTAPGNVAGKVWDTVWFAGAVIIATDTGLWRRSPTNKATQGYLDSPIYDLRSPDHSKAWRFAEIIIEDATPTEAVAFYYRTGTLSGSWLGGTTVTAAGSKKIPFPDDNPAQGLYKLNSKQIQCHTVLMRGADATKFPRLMSLAVDAAQIRPIGV